jgi:hypothetical protein
MEDHTGYRVLRLVQALHCLAYEDRNWNITVTTYIVFECRVSSQIEE